MLQHVRADKSRAQHHVHATPRASLQSECGRRRERAESWYALTHITAKMGPR